MNIDRDEGHAPSTSPQDTEKRGWYTIKSKTEFYQAYFGLLVKKGYMVCPPSSPDYVADIHRKDKPLAFYTRQDAILANPFVKVDAKHLEKLVSLAETTAISCGICTEKPYDEETAKEDSNGVVRINQHNGVVLSCRHHPLLGYVLCTYRVKFNQQKQPKKRVL
ncbi:MAG: hypothetical protein K2N63_11500 [Lachnospiraceae bacterium]|nr:hypothetical protein [Lachnospiraceae bacterium]